MPCSITIDPLEVTLPGPSIKITGTAQECQKVNVTIKCGPAGGGAAKTTDVSSGKWEADFPASVIDCPCGSHYDVVVVCVEPNNPMCKATSAGTISCGDTECPSSITFTKIDIGDCTGGKTPVTVEATVTGTGSFTAELTDGIGGSSTGSAPPSPLTLSLSGNYPGTPPVTFEVKITSPSGCTGASLGPFDFPSCAQCPDVTWTHTFLECEGSQRKVTVTAELASPDGYTADLIDVNNPSPPLATVTVPPGSGTQILSHTGFYLGGSTQEFQVVVNSPAGCSKSSETFMVDTCGGPGACCLPNGSCEELTAEECQQRGGSYKGDNTSCANTKCGDDNGDDGGFSFCSGLLVAAIGLLIAGAVGLVLGICLHIVWLIVAGGIAGGLGLIAFILWAFLCATFTSCSVMRTVYCTLWWIVAVVGPIVCIITLLFGDLGCKIAAAATWGGLGSILAWLSSIMNGLDCKPSSCF